MSARADIWKPAEIGAQPVPRRKQPRPAASVEHDSTVTGPLVSLARQLFFPAVEVRRKQVLFVAVDIETQLSSICEQLARAVSQISGGMVAIVESSALPAPEVPGKKPRNHSGNGGSGSWRRYSSELTENVWHVPTALFCAHHPACDLGDPAADLRELRETFDHVLFATSIQDTELAVLSATCGLAVLVLSANHTHREAALQAKEQLLAQNVQLLGTILADRVLPIPERIYKQL